MFLWVVIKIQNKMECSIIFQLVAKSFDLGLGMPKSKFLGSREINSMASGRRLWKEQNEIARFVPGFSNHCFCVDTHAAKLLNRR